VGLIIFVMQVAMAAPFLFDTVAKALGWSIGGNTDMWHYLYSTKILARPGEISHGSNYEYTLYWSFISSEIYHSLQFIDFLKILMLSVNVYYFFILKNCFPQCFKQLMNTFSPNKAKLLEVKQFQRKQAIEMMIICFISGICFVPGGHV